MPVVISQEEEESPAEGSKDEPGEQTELKEEAEAPVEDISQTPAPEPKEDIPEGEKPPEKENGDKSDAQVSCRLGEGQWTQEQRECMDGCLYYLVEKAEAFSDVPNSSHPETQ